MNPFSEFFGRYADFGGRTSRAEFWLTAIVIGVLWLATLGVVGVGLHGVTSATSPAAGLLILATVFPWLALAVRRLHDTGRSGWWQLLQLTGVGSIVLLVFELVKGQAGPNRFGPDPLLSVGDQGSGGGLPPPMPGGGYGPASYGGAPPGKPPKRSRLGLIVGLVVLAILVVGGLAYMGGHSGSNSSADQTASAPAALGSPIQSGDVQITITSVDQSSTVGGDLTRETAADGGVLVIVNYSLKNTSAKPVGVGDMPDITIRDPSGTVYKPDVGKTAAYASEANLTAKVLSDLNPGLTVTNAEVFEVSKASFDPSKWVVLINDGNPVAMAQATTSPAAIATPPTATSNTAAPTTTTTNTVAETGSSPAPAAQADSSTKSTDSPEYTQCINAANGEDMALADCTNSEIDRQNVRLNADYKELMSQANEVQQMELRDSERTWIRFRDHTCEEGNDTGGTIDAVNRSSCILDQTKKRAAYLEQPTSMILH